MRKLVLGVLFFTSVIGMVGCDSDLTKPSAAVTAVENRTNRTYSQLSTNDALMCVNGRALTKGELEREIAFRLRLLELRSRKRNNKKDQVRFRKRLERTFDRQFLQQELLLDYAKKAGATITEDDRAAMRKKLVSTYAPGGNTNVILKMLNSTDSRLFSERIDREILVGKGREKLISDNVKAVTDKDVAMRRTSFEKYNVRANAENAATYQKATNVWKKLNAGYPFDRMIEDYESGNAPHVSADGNWGDFKISDFKDDEGLIKAVKNTPVGFYSMPFEGDNGLMIIKVLDVLPVDEKAHRREPYYQLAKIFFELPEIWDSETDAELRADLEKIHRREAFAAGMKKVADSAKIEYPCGTNLFPVTSGRKNNAALPLSVRKRLPQNIKLNN